MDEEELIDIGSGVRIRWSWRGDEKVGLIEYHECSAGGSCPKASEGFLAGFCGGAVLFDRPQVRENWPGRELWTVEQEDPLTLSPSLACACPGCGHHGWIREGRWVPA